MAKVQASEDAWNSRDAQRTSLAYTHDSQWRNCGRFLHGRKEIRQFLTDKWAFEREYREAKSLWAFTDDCIAIRFQYEYQDIGGFWHRVYGIELWKFDKEGLMCRKETCSDKIKIEEQERKFLWPLSESRPADHAGIPGLA